MVVVTLTLRLTNERQSSYYPLLLKALMREGIIKTADEELSEHEVDLPMETMN